MQHYNRARTCSYLPVPCDFFFHAEFMNNSARGLNLNATVITPTPLEKQVEDSYVQIRHVRGDDSTVIAKRDIEPNTRLMVFPGRVIPKARENGTNARYSWAFFRLLSRERKVDWTTYTISARGAEFDAYAGKFVTEPPPQGKPNVRVVYNFTRLPTPTLEYWTSKPVKKGEALYVCFSEDTRQRGSATMSACKKSPGAQYLTKFEMPGRSVWSRRRDVPGTTRPTPTQIEGLLENMFQTQTPKRRRTSINNPGRATQRQRSHTVGSPRTNARNAAQNTGRQAPRNTNNNAGASGSRPITRSATTNATRLVNKNVAALLLSMAGRQTSQSSQNNQQARNVTNQQARNRPPSPASLEKSRANLLGSITLNEIMRLRPNLIPHHTLPNRATQPNARRNLNTQGQQAQGPRDTQHAASNSAKWNHVEKNIRDGTIRVLFNTMLRTLQLFGEAASVVLQTPVSKMKNRSTVGMGGVRVTVKPQPSTGLTTIDVSHVNPLRTNERLTVVVFERREQGELHAFLKELKIQGGGMTLVFKVIDPPPGSVKVTLIPGVQSNRPPQPQEMKDTRDTLINVATKFIGRDFDTLANPPRGPIMRVLRGDAKTWARHLTLRGGPVHHIITSPASRQT